jgi:acid phosphatase (class A)
VTLPLRGTRELFNSKADRNKERCRPSRTPEAAVILAAFLAALPAFVMVNGSAKAQPAAVPEFRPGFLKGYLPQDGLPNSLALIPSPPASGSAALALDQAFSKSGLALRDTPRWKLATEDADLSFPNTAGTFSCALDAPITQIDTPHLYMVLRRSLTDAGLSTYSAKNHYRRSRPFAMNHQPICTPGHESKLMKDGSYPSGHTAVGWAWALILSEVSPDHSDAILARGRAFGQSRVICNVHWESDVLEGRFMGAAAVSRLHADPIFQADLKAGEAELAAVRARHLKPTRDCAVEASEMALDPLQAP